MLLAILHDHHTINIVTNILVILAGLYAYQGLPGVARPGGLLRQLLVGILLAIIYGVGNYFFDVAANHIFSNTVRELVQFPGIPMSSLTIGVIGAVTGLLFPLTSPNFFRLKRWQKVSIPVIALLFLITIMGGTFWNALGIEAMFKLFGPWFTLHPPLPSVIVVAFVLSLISFSFNIQLGLLHPANNTTPDMPQPTLASSSTANTSSTNNATPDMLQPTLASISSSSTNTSSTNNTASDMPQSTIASISSSTASTSSTNNTTPDTPQPTLASISSSTASTSSTNNTTPGTPRATLQSCIVSLIVLIPMISLWVYFGLAVGWGTCIIYVGILLLAGALVMLIQAGVDRMSDQVLLEISLVLFLLAAVLQMYQAIAQ
jgi:hypothetical protein